MCVCLFQSGQFSEDMIPTVGFNMRKITKGNVTIKVGVSEASAAAAAPLVTGPLSFPLFLPPCSSPAVGHRRSAPLQEHVGALLPWGQRHCVSSPRASPS